MAQTVTKQLLLADFRSNRQKETRLKKRRALRQEFLTAISPRPRRKAYSKYVNRQKSRDHQAAERVAERARTLLRKRVPSKTRQARALGTQGTDASTGKMPTVDQSRGRIDESLEIVNLQRESASALQASTAVPGRIGTTASTPGKGTGSFKRMMPSPGMHRQMNRTMGASFVNATPSAIISQLDSPNKDAPLHQISVVGDRHGRNTSNLLASHMSGKGHRRIVSQLVVQDAGVSQLGSVAGQHNETMNLNTTHGHDDAGFRSRMQTSMHPHSLLGRDVRSRGMTALSQHITGRPVSMHEMHRQKQQVYQKFMNNRRFFNVTHTKYTKSSRKESVDLNELRSLPENYVSFYSNKTILNRKSALQDLYNEQRMKYENQFNHKWINQIQKECLVHCDIDEGARLRELQKAKIQKLSDQIKPTMDEIDGFKKELERELKQNPIHIHQLQMQKIEQKFHRKQQHLERRIKEKIAAAALVHMEFAANCDRNIAALELDDDTLAKEISSAQAQSRASRNTGAHGQKSNKSSANEDSPTRIGRQSKQGHGTARQGSAKQFGASDQGPHSKRDRSKNSNQSMRRNLKSADANANPRRLITTPNQISSGQHTRQQSSANSRNKQKEQQKSKNHSKQRAQRQQRHKAKMKLKQQQLELNLDDDQMMEIRRINHMLLKRKTSKERRLARDQQKAHENYKAGDQFLMLQ